MVDFFNREQKKLVLKFKYSKKKNRKKRIREKKHQCLSIIILFETIIFYKKNRSWWL